MYDESTDLVGLMFSVGLHVKYQDACRQKAAQLGDGGRRVLKKH